MELSLYGPPTRTHVETTEDPSGFLEICNRNGIITIEQKERKGRSARRNSDEIESSCSGYRSRGMNPSYAGPTGITTWPPPSTP